MSNHRAHPKYEQGAWKFVQMVTKNLRYPKKKLCPCIDCPSVSHWFGSTVVEHLVVRGVDAKYKRKYLKGHEQHTISGEEVGEMVNDETNNLYRAAQFFVEDYINATEFVDGDCIEPTEERPDDNFIKNLKMQKPLCTRIVQITTSYEPLQVYIELKPIVDGLIRISMSFLRHCSTCYQRTMYFCSQCTR